MTSWSHRSPIIGSDIAPYIETTWSAIRKVDFSGYDPGSFRGRKGRRLFWRSRSIPARIWNSAISRLRRFAGFSGVRLEGLPEIRSTKAIALCASAFAALARAGIIEARDQGKEVLGLLLQERDPELHLWTVDFEYMIRGASVPRGQLGLINTLFACEAVWDWSHLGGSDSIDLTKVITDTAEHLLASLPRWEDEHYAAFTYNPSARYYVHNANALIAVLLARASYAEGGRADLDEIAAKCVRFILRDIQEVGHLRYAGPPTPNSVVDNYHTGYVLRAFQRLRSTSVATRVGEDELSRVVEDLVRFYVRTFVGPRGVTKHPDGRYVHTHSLAEALSVYAEFAEHYPRCFGCSFQAGVRKTFTDLWDERRGYFINAKWYLPGGFVRSDVTPMVRWSWSWILYGLARLLEVERTQSNS